MTKEIFIKDIDEESKLYKITNKAGDTYYVIKELDEGEYLKLFSTLAKAGEPEKMINYYKNIKTSFWGGRWIKN